MSARRNPVVRVLAVVIAIVVAVIVVIQLQSGSSRAPTGSPPGSTAAGGTNEAGANKVGVASTASQSGEAETREVISLSTLILELDMSVPAGQNLLDAIGAAEMREGRLSADQLAAAMALRPRPNTLARAMVFNSAGAMATVTIDESGAAAGVAPTVRKIELDLTADVNEDGTLSIDAGFRMMRADGQFEVLAEEWGLPLGTRRSASASEELAPGQGMFIRRRFGSVEILVLVSAEVMPPKDDG